MGIIESYWKTLLTSIYPQLVEALFKFSLKYQVEFWNILKLRPSKLCFIFFSFMIEKLICCSIGELIFCMLIGWILKFLVLSLFCGARLRSYMELCILIPGGSSKLKHTSNQVSLLLFPSLCLWGTILAICFVSLLLHILSFLDLFT